jgi:hypothetical protein
MYRILVADNESLARQHAKIIKKDLEDAGFIINEDKSVWVSSQKLVWLGF